MNDGKLIFVCGALRSGTSLLHLMLNHHPELKNPGEFDFFFDLVTDDYQSPKVHVYENWLLNHRIFLSKNLIFPRDAKEYSEVLRSFKAQLSEENKVLLINIHRNFDKIPAYFPEAKYIHLIRDPRDVARSSIGMGWAGNVYYGVDHWIETERSWSNLKPTLSDNQFLEIYFEDLITDPQVTLKRICEFCGVAYTDSMMNYHESSTYEKPDVNLIFQWKRKLSENEVKQVESKIAETLEGLKYEKSQYENFNGSLLEKTFLKIQNKLYKLQFSIKRYGLFLVIRERLSRWLNLVNLSKTVRTEMNEIDKSVIK